MAHCWNQQGSAAAMGNGESNHGPQEIRDVMDGLCLTEAVQVSNESASSFLEGVRADARHTFFPEVMDVPQPKSSCLLLNLQGMMMKNCAIELLLDSIKALFPPPVSYRLVPIVFISVENVSLFDCVRQNAHIIRRMLRCDLTTDPPFFNQKRKNTEAGRSWTRVVETRGMFQASCEESHPTDNQDSSSTIAIFGVSFPRSTCHPRAAPKPCTSTLSSSNSALSHPLFISRRAHPKPRLGPVGQRCSIKEEEG